MSPDHDAKNTTANAHESKPRAVRSATLNEMLMLMYPTVHEARIDRLREYDACDPANVMQSLNLPLITKAHIVGDVVSTGNGHEKYSDSLGRIRRFYYNASNHDRDAILISNGLAFSGSDLDEPHIYDGRHRYLAAVFRGDKTIKALFHFGPNIKGCLPLTVIDYLCGKTQKRPTSGS